MTSLDKVKVGNKVMVKEISKNTYIRRRLLDMGIIPGIEVMVKGKAPLGDPMEILIRGYKLTLRKKEASNILVE
jgi:ferrous iron transport protein A